MTKILDRVFVVLGTFLFLQIPLFMHQYQLQLIGHVNELEWQISAMRENSAKSGKNLDQYIKKFIDHSDEDFSSQGMIMSLMFKRWKKLSAALLKLQQASLFTRPFVFLFYLQWGIFKSTAATFQSGISFTIESFSYAILGMASGYLLFQFFNFFWKKIFRKKSRNSLPRKQFSSLNQKFVR